MPTQGKTLKAYKHIHRDTHTHTQNSCSHCRNSVKNAVTGWSHKPGSSLFSGAIAWNELLPPLPSPKPFQCYGGQNPCSSVLPCWLVVTVRHTEQSASRLDDFLPPFSTHRHVHFVFPIFHTPTTTLSSKVAAQCKWETALWIKQTAMQYLKMRATLKADLSEVTSTFLLVLKPESSIMVSLRKRLLLTYLLKLTWNWSNHFLNHGCVIWSEVRWRLQEPKIGVRWGEKSKRWSKGSFFSWFGKSLRLLQNAAGLFTWTFSSFGCKG